MSEHSKILEKYEKMFEDGSAYQPIQLNQPTPDVGSIDGVKEKPDIPLGDAVDRDVFMDQNADYSEFDSQMQNRVNEIRNKKTHDNTSNVSVQNNGELERLERLTKRVDLLEQALSLVMETQKKLLQD
jgi:hypothetical protein